MTMQVRRARLINVHNFVDETVELRDGGHLFLLGDNGSGKTTVLDAIHDVLAGGEVEWNAAARVSGRRDAGRSLQGVVLRLDAERGVRREGGAIAYAAVELGDGHGREVTLVLGTAATTLDARVARWGAVVARPLAEVPLLNGDDRPLDRDALRQALGPAAVTTLAGYRREVATRLFGSEAAYAEATRCWAMAKAYREIVAGARDFAGLFARLLPRPDGAVFDEILQALAAIDDLELALRDLDDQAAYATGLAELVRGVAVAREAAARYRWLACHRAVDEATQARDQARRDEAARQEKLRETLRRSRHPVSSVDWGIWWLD